MTPPTPTQEAEIARIVGSLTENQVDEEQLRDIIRARIGFDGGKRVYAQDLANEFGVSKAYLSDVLNGRRGIADRLANAAGYERIVTFRPLAVRSAIEDSKGRD